MKKAIFILAAIAASAVFTFANAAPAVSTGSINTRVNAVPPQVVLNAYTAMFGNAPLNQWKLRSNGNWRAHFTLNGVAWEATFTSAGTLVKSERA